MIFWSIAAALALITSGLIAAALLRGRASVAPPAAYDLAIYRVQLKEVDRDLLRGTITESEAERIRAEVSRRILAADAQVKAHGPDGGQPRRIGTLLATVLAVFLTGGALAGYATLGAPGYRDLPRKARLAASETARSERLAQAEAEARFGQAEQPLEPSEDFAELMEKLRATVKERPDDLRGLALLARNEAGLGHTGAALRAQTQLVRLKGDAAEAGDHALLAGLMITAAGGYVSQEAEASLRTALTLNPRHLEARYYLGAYYAQVDRPDAAFRTWEQLLQDSPADAPWLPTLRARTADAAERAGIRYTLPDLGSALEMAGPSTEQIEAIEAMSEDDRQALIHSMVDGLMTRLATEGGPAEEWARLITALGVLGDTERAEAIWGEAQETFAGQSAALELLQSAAGNAGLSPAAVDTTGSATE